MNMWKLFWHPCCKVVMLVMSLSIACTIMGLAQTTIGLFMPDGQLVGNYSSDVLNLSCVFRQELNKIPQPTKITLLNANVDALQAKTSNNAEKSIKALLDVLKEPKKLKKDSIFEIFVQSAFGSDVALKDVYVQCNILKDINKIKNCLEVASNLFFSYEVKLGIAKVFALYLYQHKTKQLLSNVTYDLELIDDGAKELFNNLSSSAKSAVRQEYLLNFRSQLDVRPIVIDELPQDKSNNYQKSEVYNFVKNLMIAKILPKPKEKLKELSEINSLSKFSEYLASIFNELNAWRPWLRPEIDKYFQDKWLDLLPTCIQNETKIDLLKLNPKSNVRFQYLEESGWKRLVGIGFIPENRQKQYKENNLAKYYVDNFEYLFVRNNVSTIKLRSLPPTFVTEFKRAYRCKKILNRLDLWLDKDDKIIIPVSLIKSYGLSISDWNVFDTTEDHIKKMKELQRRIDFFENGLKILSTKKVRYFVDFLTPYRDDGPEKTNFLKEKKDQIIRVVKTWLNDGSSIIGARNHPQDLQTTLTSKCVELLNFILNQIQIKLAWAFADKIPNEPLDYLTSGEWTLLADRTRIPKLNNFVNYNDIALGYVNTFVDRRFEKWRSYLGLWRLADVEHKAESWLCALPLEFQLEVVRFYAGKMKSLGKGEIFLACRGLANETVWEGMNESQKAHYEIVFKGIDQSEINKTWPSGAGTTAANILNWCEKGIKPLNGVLSDRDLTVREWEFLANKKRVPMIRFENKNTSAIAKEFVNTGKSNAFVKKDPSDPKKFISNDTLKILPKPFQEEFARYFRCYTLRGKKDLWLDDNRIYVPVKYLAEYGLTSLIDSKQIWQDLDTDEKVTEAQVQEKVAWACAGTIPTHPLKSVSPEEWRYLAENGRIPSLRFYENYRQIAKTYVKRYLSSWVEFLTSWSGFKLTKKGFQNQSAEWLLALPEDFQREVRIYFQCFMIKNGTPNVKLDNKQLDVPIISYLVETGVLLKKPENMQIEEVKRLEKSDIAKLTRIYADEIHIMDRSVATKIVSSLPEGTLASIAVAYANKPGHDTTFLAQMQNRMSGEYGFTFSDLMTSFKLPQSEKHEFKIYGYPITEITHDSVKKIENYTQITKFVIAQTQLKSLPKTIFDALTNLQEIVIADNAYLTSLPANLFANNKQLKKIIITGNPKLNPDVDVFNDIKQELDIIDLSNNNLDVLPIFFNLKLKSLKLNNNKLTKIADGTLSSIRSASEIAKHLVEVHLQNNTGLIDKGLGPLSLLPRLQYLDLSNTRIANIFSIIDLKLLELKYLFLAHNNAKLSFEKEQPPTISGPGTTAKTVKSDYEWTLPKLETLDISYCQLLEVYSKFFIPFPALKIIVATGNQFVREQGGCDFSGIRTLERLYLGQCGIKKIDSRSFTNLENLKILALEGNSIKDIPIGAFKNLTNLEELYLFKNAINKIDDNGLVLMSKLKNLDLSYNNLQSISEKTFSHTEMLEKLNLKNNKIQQIPGGAFQSLSRIKYLNLEDNEIRVLGYNAFSGISDKKVIKFRGNNAFGWTKPLQTLSNGVFARDVDREWFNRGQLSTMLVTAITGATVMLFPVASLPAVLSVVGAGIYGISGAALRTKNAVTDTIKNAIHKRSLEFRFIKGNEWPGWNLEYKKLETIWTYFDLVTRRYSFILEDKSKIIEVVEEDQK